VVVPLVILLIGIGILWWGSWRAVRHQYLWGFLGTALILGAIGVYMWLAARSTTVARPMGSSATPLPGASSPGPAGEGGAATTGPVPWLSPSWVSATSHSAAFAATLSVVAVLIAGVGLAIGVDAKVATSRVDTGVTDVSRLAGAGTHAEAQVEKAQVAQLRVVLAEQHSIAQQLVTLNARVRLLESIVTRLDGQNAARMRAAKTSLAALQRYYDGIEAKTQRAVERLEGEERDAVTSTRSALNELKEAIPMSQGKLRANIEALKETIQQSTMGTRADLVKLEPSAEVLEAQREANGAQL
jgi:hypothetical protein